MAGQGQILLDLPELIFHHDPERVFLAVDYPLLQLRVDRPGHRCRVGAQILPDGLMHGRGHDPDLQPLDIRRTLDRMAAVGQVPETVFGKAEAFEARAFQILQDLRPQRTIEDGIRLGTVLEQEGVINHPDDGVEGIKGAAGDDPHLHGVQLDLLQDLGLIADGAGVEDLDGDIALGLFLDQFLKLVGNDILGGAGLGYNAQFDGHRRMDRSGRQEDEETGQRAEIRFHFSPDGEWLRHERVF